jgi:predicted  nucleic acid-binding Zn-ribbon protein
MVHLKSVREQVLAAHPDLQAEADKLKIAHDAMQAQNPPPTAEQINAAYAEWKDYQTKVRAEMLKIDPTLKPLFDKIDDARKHGAPAPFSSTTGQK